MKTMTWRGKLLEKALGNELELLRILCAEFEIRNGGKLKAALAQARKSKKIISSQSIETYTDIEVSLNCGNGHILLRQVSGGNYPCILQNSEQSPDVVQLGCCRRRCTSEHMSFPTMELPLGSAATSAHSKEIRTAFESTRTIGFFVEAPTRLQRAQDLVDFCDKHYVADQQPGLLLLVEIKLFQA
jgi:hypothetical protein